jgi:hypothetical protein
MFTSREPARDGAQRAVGKAGIWRKLGKGRYFDLNWLRPPKQQIALEHRIYHLSRRTNTAHWTPLHRSRLGMNSRHNRANRTEPTAAWRKSNQPR